MKVTASSGKAAKAQSKSFSKLAASKGNNKLSLENGVAAAVSSLKPKKSVTIVNREDMIKAEDLGEYYRIPADNRDLNYEQYFSEGMPDIANLNEYHSHNTAILDVEGMKQLLLKLPIIRKDILGEVDAIQYPY
jgi:hypothetical protein